MKKIELRTPEDDINSTNQCLELLYEEINKFKNSQDENKTYLNTNDNVSCKLKNNMNTCIINNFPIEILIENKLITLIIITILISNFFLLQ